LVYYVFNTLLLIIEFLHEKIAKRKKMREVQGPSYKPPDQNINRPVVVSIADEIAKLAKLKEQGVITEEEFLQMKSNLILSFKIILDCKVKCYRNCET
jgi:hypothetical protein